MNNSVRNFATQDLLEIPFLPLVIYLHSITISKAEITDVQRRLKMITTQFSDKYYEYYMTADKYNILLIFKNCWF